MRAIEIIGIVNVALALVVFLLAVVHFGRLRRRVFGWAGAGGAVLAIGYVMSMAWAEHFFARSAIWPAAATAEPR